MYVVDVIPLSRTAPGVLSYRSSTKLPVGSIVDIVLRKTATQGIVVACMPVADAKEMLKHARFMLSKSAPSVAGILPEPLMRAAEAVAEYQGTSIGAVLTALFAEHIRSDAGISLGNFEKGSGFSETGVELPITERAVLYREHIEAALADEKSIIIVVPTIAECSFWKEAFSIFKPLVLSGAVSGNKRKALLELIGSHRGLIIATPSFSWAPIAALGGIIVDRVSAGTYTLPKRPYIYVPRALERLARERQLPILYGDFPLPLEYRENRNAKTAKVTNVSLVDMRKDPDDQKEAEAKWSIFSDPVIEQIAKECAEAGRVVVIAARSGYSPAVVCRDCGQALTDERGMPFSFTTLGGKRLFRTSDGKTVLDAKMQCPRCDSWNLLPLGIGQERVVEELRKFFPGEPIVDASSERLRTPAGAKKVIAESNVPGSITVGGEALLPWFLSKTIASDALPLGIIASADSLLSLPFWRSRERFVRLCYFFSSICTEVLLLTRRPEDTAVSAATGKDVPAFWNEESSLRKALGYPPSGTLMTFTAEGSVAAVERTLAPIFELLGAYSPSQLPDMPLAQNGVRRIVVVSLPEGVWPDKELSQKLQQLPPNIRIRIDPDSIW